MIKVPSSQSYDPAVDPVLCSPYEPPDLHWQLDDLGRAERGVPPLQGRRAPLRISVPDDTKQAQTVLRLNDRQPDRIIKLLRDHVKDWRASNYEGATATTRRLLWHWTDPQSMRLRPFFAQVEAIETFVWLREIATRATPVRRDLEIASRHYNDQIVRLCAKMATGTGKTAVMGMLIAWQTLNAARSRRVRNVQHTNRFAVFTPGHTVRQRLSVLLPSDPDNVYDEMGLVPHDLRPMLNRARVRIVNYQAFTQKELIEDAQARRLLGQANGENRENWSAAVRRVLGSITDSNHPVCVINDEAHHCYLPEETRRRSRDDKAEDARAAVWFNVIRSMRDQGMLGKTSAEHGQECPVYDFSATPLWINQAAKSEPEQFQWVASDFGLMDAIESGLVKVPRVPIDDDSSRDETVWRRLYHNTSPKKLKQHFETARAGQSVLPENLHGAVEAVVADYQRKLEAWMTPDGDTGAPAQPTPPVIIFVANDISNATALWKYLSGGTLDSNGQLSLGRFPELSNTYQDSNGTRRWHATPRTLLVHSKIGGEDTIPDDLKTMLIEQSGLSRKADAEEAVREMLNTVGKQNKPGSQVRCVVSVSMLTEGWDARTVTHIVGFRAFGTQLLCEQVTGRALRRTSYDAFREPDPDGRVRLEPEYADVVGIPFEFMPDVGAPEPTAKAPKPRTNVRTVRSKTAMRVAWPQAVEYFWTNPHNHFRFDPNKVTAWQPQTLLTPTITSVAGVAGQEGTYAQGDDNQRWRSLLLELAKSVMERIVEGNQEQGIALARASLFRSSVKAVEQWASHTQVALSFFGLRDIVIDPALRQHAQTAIISACDGIETEHGSRRAHLARPPIMDTSNIDFETTLQHILTDPKKSELSHAACHSRWELSTAEALEANQRVLRWVRNFQLGWTIPYWRDSAWARYEPDFIAVLDNGVNLIIECKGVPDSKSEQAKDYTLNHWIPSIAGTIELPDSLRSWHYTIINNRDTIRADLDTAIKASDRINQKAA